MEAAGLGFDLPDLGILQLGGALCAPGLAGGAVPGDFQEEMQALLNLPAQRAAQPGQDPLLAPPIYGAWQAAQLTVPDEEEGPRWLRQLNLDPRHRATAGLGVLAIQDQQEQLMASAWDQLGLSSRQQQPFRQAQLGQAVLGSVHQKRLAKLTPEQLFQLTGPLHTRVRTSPDTLAHLVRQSSLPETASSASFRRFLRPSGPLLRRAAAKAPSLARPGAIVQRIARTPVVGIFIVLPRPGMVTPQATRNKVNQVLRIHRLLESHGQEIDQASVRYLEALVDLQGYLENVTAITSPPAKSGLELSQVSERLLAGLDPRKTISSRLSARLATPRPGNALLAAPLGQAEPEEAALAAFSPEFPQPMYEALRELAPGLLLPGAGQIPPNRVTIVQTNPAFIEAYMVGLNHEMSRELLWREFPTDQRGTYFREFWDRRGSVNGAAGGGEGRIEPIHDWNPARGLGQNLGEASTGKLVLLVRGELLMRYPGTVIYAVEAVSREKLGARTLYPIFRGTLEPDITFLGFDLTRAMARGEDGKPGWFIVIQQQPGEPRFGLDAPETIGGDPKALKNWNELSWGHLAKDQQALEALTHAPLGGRLKGQAIGGIEWGFNAAHMAAITLQRPMRVAIHAGDLLAAA
jgi:hypothetical protein